MFMTTTEIQTRLLLGEEPLELSIEKYKRLRANKDTFENMPGTDQLDQVSTVTCALCQKHRPSLTGCAECIIGDCYKTPWNGMKPAISSGDFTTFWARVDAMIRYLEGLRKVSNIVANMTMCDGTKLHCKAILGFDGQINLVACDSSGNELSSGSIAAINREGQLVLCDRLSTYVNVEKTKNSCIMMAVGAVHTLKNGTHVRLDETADAVYIIACDKNGKALEAGNLVGINKGACEIIRCQNIGNDSGLDCDDNGRLFMDGETSPEWQGYKIRLNNYSFQIQGKDNLWQTICHLDASGELGVHQMGNTIPEIKTKRNGHIIVY